MIFEPGQTVMRRYVMPDNRIGLVHCGRVLSDNNQGVMTWVAGGSGTAARLLLDGTPVRRLPLAQQSHVPTVLTPTTWTGHGVLQWTPVASISSGFAVWWFFNDDGSFKGWYVNLETPATRWHGGVDVRDHALDVWINADYTWQWQDEDEFAERTNIAGYWNPTEAAHIRSAGETAIRLAQARTFPFDGTWCNFTANPAWQPTPLPWWWDRPTVLNNRQNERINTHRARST